MITTHSEATAACIWFVSQYFTEKVVDDKTRCQLILERQGIDDEHDPAQCLDMVQAFKKFHQG